MGNRSNYQHGMGYIAEDFLARQAEQAETAEVDWAECSDPLDTYDEPPGPDPDEEKPAAFGVPGLASHVHEVLAAAEPTLRALGLRCIARGRAIPDMPGCFEVVYDYEPYDYEGGGTTPKEA